MWLTVALCNTIRAEPKKQSQPSRTVPSSTQTGMTNSAFKYSSNGLYRHDNAVPMTTNHVDLNSDFVSMTINSDDRDVAMAMNGLDPSALTTDDVRIHSDQSVTLTTKNLPHGITSSQNIGIGSHTTDASEVRRPRSVSGKVSVTSRERDVIGSRQSDDAETPTVSRSDAGSGTGSRSDAGTVTPCEYEYQAASPDEKALVEACAR